MCVARKLGFECVIDFLDHFLSFLFFRSDDQDLLDDDQSNFDSQDQESQAWNEEHNFDWLYSNYYYYYIFSPVCDDVPYEVFWPQTFFYVEARDSKQKTQKNLKNDHPERNFWIFLLKIFLMSVN